MKKLPKNGKVRTTKEENIELQKIFLKLGFTFHGGRTEHFDRDNLDFFYWIIPSERFSIILLDSKDSEHSNNNFFNYKTWNGEQHFKKQKNKEFKFSELEQFLKTLI